MENKGHQDEEEFLDQEEDVETRINRLENQVALLINHLHYQPNHGHIELHALGNSISYDDLKKMNMAVSSAKKDCVSPEEFVKRYNAQFPKYKNFLSSTLNALKKDHICIDYCDKVLEYLKSIKKST